MCGNKEDFKILFRDLFLSGANVLIRNDTSDVFTCFFFLYQYNTYDQTFYERNLLMYILKTCFEDFYSKLKPHIRSRSLAYDNIYCTIRIFESYNSEW